MANQSLLNYLMVAPPGLPTQSTNKTPNTTNPHYSWKDITSVNPWPQFTYTNIMQRFGAMLQQIQIAREPMPNSPAQAIATEPMFAALDIGDAASIINNFRPDLAFFQAGSVLHTSPNRCPGDLKVSWKWASGYRMAPDEGDRKEYYQVLSQVNFYMKQNYSRYGYILSDTELVPIKRLDGNGSLLVAQAIPWEAEGPGRLTILLGLWYLGMLASADNDWRLP
ncbi:conserved hypothetical protein [Histoplasma capsulatum var. duboisii H88]|uniref:Uncharacterized protein n=1 Tax=Ajellomyces capsulatus (strain H88) TaxID=544711 RepID=F0UEW8_AJEC8|nr:conserved hypothetical protein [Histoplasma capsulatum var. duboisii H88]